MIIMGPATCAQGNVAHDTEYCILDNKFRDLVTERQGFEWVDEAKPDSYVRTSLTILGAVRCNSAHAHMHFVSAEA